MDQNSNYITIEMNFRLQLKDYRLVLGMRRAWIVAIIVGVIQLIAWAKEISFGRAKNSDCT